jgi:hypothetical protein
LLAIINPATFYLDKKRFAGFLLADDVSENERNACKEISNVMNSLFG